MSASVSLEEKKAAIVALAYTKEKAGATAMLDLAQNGHRRSPGPRPWLVTQAEERAMERPRARCRTQKTARSTILETSKVVEVIAPPSPKTKLPPINEILSIQGDTCERKGRSNTLLHLPQNQGNRDWLSVQTSLDLLKPRLPRSSSNQSSNHQADISHGFAGREIITKDGKTVHGIALTSGDPVIMQSVGGLQQTIPKEKIKSQKNLGHSLMLSADQLGMTAQDLADLLAYLKIPVRQFLPSRFTELLKFQSSKFH
jgi:hypothetical protein